MKRFLKFVCAFALVLVLGAVAVVGLVMFLHWRDEGRLQQLVMTLPPGTPFSAVVERLGPPTQIVTNPDEMPAYRRSRERVSSPGWKLNLFVYRGTGFYWVLVFTDVDSKIIQHAEWNAM